MIKMIKVSEELHKQLEDYKIHPRETFEDAIKRAITKEPEEAQIENTN